MNIFMLESFYKDGTETSAFYEYAQFKEVLKGLM